MKIVIGITGHPEKIVDFIELYQGEKDSLTEVGPFLSWEEALGWQNGLKSKIENIEEVSVEPQTFSETVYYGFTFERVG